MIFKNPRIVRNLRVHIESGKSILDTFLHYKAEQGEHWFDPRWIGERMYDKICRLEKEEEPDRHLETAVIDYDRPKMLSHSLNRNDAVRLLKSLGLKSPSTFETFRIAAQTMISNELKQTIKENERRDIVAATPFHPEDPTFFVFRARPNEDDCLRQEFRRLHHFTDGADNLLFFQTVRAWSVETERRIFFPLILGIK